MSPSKIYLHFSHIEKTLKKAIQELVDFCMVFLKNSDGIAHFSHWYKKSQKNLAFFLKTPIVCLRGELYADNVG